ncbi:MAG: protease HtpX, partial [Gammaproteobacteria bacterium]
MQRIFLFMVTNIAILVVFGSVLRLLGVDSLLDEQGVHLDYRALLIYAAVLGFSGALVSLALSKWTAKRLTGARVLKTARTDEERWLMDTVARQARQAGIGMPEVAIYDAPDMNAFATGARRNHSLVAVSSGLLRRMQRGEVEAVLAHEVTHIANGDMITLALLQGVINTFVIVLSRIIGHFVDRVILKNRRGHGPGFWITALIAELALAVLASIIV